MVLKKPVAITACSLCPRLNKNPDAHREHRGQGGCKKAAKDDSLCMFNVSSPTFVWSSPRLMDKKLSQYLM